MMPPAEHKRTPELGRPLIDSLGRNCAAAIAASAVLLVGFGAGASYWQSGSICLESYGTAVGIGVRNFEGVQTNGSNTYFTCPLHVTCSYSEAVTSLKISMSGDDSFIYLYSYSATGSSSDYVVLNPSHVAGWEDVTTDLQSIQRYTDGHIVMGVWMDGDDVFHGYRYTESCPL